MTKSLLFATKTSFMCIKRFTIVIILHCVHEKLIKLKAKTQMYKTCDLHSLLDIFSSGWPFEFNSKRSPNVCLRVDISLYQLEIVLVGGKFYEIFWYYMTIGQLFFVQLHHTILSESVFTCDLLVSKRNSFFHSKRISKWTNTLSLFNWPCKQSFCDLSFVLNNNSIVKI